MSNATQEALFETAKRLMALQSELKQRITAVELDPVLLPQEKHSFIEAALDLCSGLFSQMYGGNEQFLEEMVAPGSHRVKRQYIAGVEVPARTYERVVKRAGYMILNKGDNTSWSAILQAAAKTTPDVIQARITDSKVTPKFLDACAGLIGFKDSSEAWSVKRESYLK